MRPRSIRATLLPSGDYRLVLPAAVVWMMTVVGLLAPHAPLRALAAIAATCCGAGAFALWRRWVRWPRVWVTVVVAGLAAMTLAALVLRIDARDRHLLSHTDGKMRVTATIRDDPVGLGPAGSERVRVRVAVDGLAGRPVPPASAELTGAADAWVDLLPGQRVSALVRVGAPRGPGLDAARLTAVTGPRLLGRPPPHQRGAGRVRHRLQVLAARALGPEAAGLLPGLVLGDTGALDQRVRDDFRAAGLTHLIAVSGSNFAIVTGAAVLAVRMLGASPRLTAVVGLAIVVGFVILVRPSPSVLRAAMMGTVSLLALAGSRRAQAMPALGAATMVGLLWWPELAIAPGFVLSVLATGGLVLWSAALRDWLRDRRVPRGLAELVAMSLAAQLVTAPMIAALSGQFSVVAIVANIVVTPVVGIVGIVGTAAAVIGAVGGADQIAAAVADLMIRALGPELWWMIACARVLGRQSWATVQVPAGIVGAVMVAAGILALVSSTLVAVDRRERRLHAARVGVGPVWHHGRRE